MFNDNEESISRVVPQVQGHNLDDYYSLLTGNGLMIGHNRVPYASKRKIYKGYHYFDDEIETYISEEKRNKPKQRR